MIAILYRDDVRTGWCPTHNEADLICKVDTTLTWAPRKEKNTNIPQMVLSEVVRTVGFTGSLTIYPGKEISY